MKKHLLLCLAFIMMIMVSSFSYGQKIPSIPTQVVPAEPVPAIPQLNTAKTPGLLVPLDGSFTLAVMTGSYDPLDDGAFGPVAFGFNFCFYGTPEASCYINNNGNITFGGPAYDFSSTGFPTSGFPMCAPFWADVDRRGGLGEVYYKLDAHKLVVIWNNVGYYNMQGDKRNTFEVILTDGTDPVLPPGDNIGFSFADMQWTTGSFSGGTGGFGGVPATVGVNQGDNVRFAQVGRFDHEGIDYDGAGGAADGVSYLDDKAFHFDGCQQTIIIPPTIPTMTEWGLIILGLALLGFGTFYIVRMRG